MAPENVEAARLRQRLVADALLLAPLWWRFAATLDSLR